MFLVLVLVSLVAVLALPNLQRLLAAATARTERDHILDQLAGLGRQAMLQRRSYVVFGTDTARGSEGPDSARTVGATQGAWPEEHASDPLRHADHERYRIDLPEGWELRVDEPLVVRANGVCLGAVVTLLHSGAEDARIELVPPYCRIDPDA